MWWLIRQKVTRVYSDLEELGGTVRQDVKQYLNKSGENNGFYLVSFPKIRTIHHKMISNLKHIIILTPFNVVSQDSTMVPYLQASS